MSKFHRGVGCWPSFLGRPLAAGRDCSAGPIWPSNMRLPFYDSNAIVVWTTRNVWPENTNGGDGGDDGDVAWPRDHGAQSANWADR